MIFCLLLILLVIKNVQREDMHIDIVMDQLKGLPSFFFENYMENRFVSTIIVAKEITNKMEVEPIFCEKSVIHREKKLMKMVIMIKFSIS